jgi:hypothetical protein
MLSMKFFLIFICVFASGPFTRAGVFDWVTARKASWDYVQATGGLKIGEPVQRENRWMLPVEYEAHGTRAVTRRPTALNSAPHTWKAKIVRKDARLHLTVVTALAGGNDELTAFRETSLKGIPPGRYEVFYGREAVSERALGTIEIPVETRAASSAK